MKRNKNLFYDHKSTGNMLVELLLSVALAMTVIPFVFKYQQNVVIRAENISIANQMSNIQNMLERYISVNRENLIKTVGRDITRIELPELVEYGLASEFAEQHKDEYQLRVLKSQDVNNKAILQGVVVLSSGDITPLRTRQLVSVGDNMGFVDGTRAYGTFGAWHADSVDLGISADDGLIQMTEINRDETLYLWRIPSDDKDDATMLSSLSLGGHDITNIKFLDVTALSVSGFVNATNLVSRDVNFATRTTIDNQFKTDSATVLGTLTSDSRNMEVLSKMSISDVGKFSNFVANDLWVSNLNLSDISIIQPDDKEEVCTMHINNRLDMTYGRVTAVNTIVGYTGSVTPKLEIYQKIQDSVNPGYYWDVLESAANFADLSFPDLNTMAKRIVASDGAFGTSAYKTFSSVTANNNATVGDFLNALSEIEHNVKAKYQMLNLE